MEGHTPLQCCTPTHTHPPTPFTHHALLSQPTKQQICTAHIHTCGTCHTKGILRAAARLCTTPCLHAMRPMPTQTQAPALNHSHLSLAYYFDMLQDMLVVGIPETFPMHPPTWLAAQERLTYDRCKCTHTPTLPWPAPHQLLRQATQLPAAGQHPRDAGRGA
jgi:hypothetical protein